MALAVGNPAKVNGRLSVTKRPSGRVSADEPNSVQPASDGQAKATRIQAGAPVQSTKSPQMPSSSVNARGGLKGMVKNKLFGRSAK